MRVINKVVRFFTTARPNKTYIESQEYKPMLRIHSTVVPESYLKKFKSWDSELYPNQTIIKD